VKKNGVFLFVISHLIPEIFKIFVLCKLGTDDVTRCDNMEVKTRQSNAAMPLKTFQKKSRNVEIYLTLPIDWLCLKKLSNLQNQLIVYPRLIHSILSLFLPVGSPFSMIGALLLYQREQSNYFLTLSFYS